MSILHTPLIFLLVLIHAPADDSVALQGLLDEHRPGRPLVLEPRVYHLRETLFVGSNIDLRGSPDGRTVLKFDLPPEVFAVAIKPDSAFVKISGLTFVGGGIRMSDGRAYRQIEIRRNTFTALNDTAAVYAAIQTHGLIVERNHFHDFNHNALLVYHFDRGSFSFNRMDNIAQGAHILNPHDDVKVVGNHGTRIHRMGIEIQQLDRQAPWTRNLLVKDNVFHDWRRPFYDSFGLSIMPERSTNTIIEGNFVLATHQGPRGPVNDMGNLFGFGIEAGFETGIIRDNIVAGPWWYGIMVSRPNMRVATNRIFGIAPGHEIAGEVEGVPVPVNNIIHPTLDKLPAIPEPRDDIPPAYRPDGPVG